MKTLKGKYIPVNIAKYRGDYRNIIYRSSWELKFMKYCDMSPSIMEWGSEEIVIPYRSPLDGRVHRIFQTFILKSNKVLVRFRSILLKLNQKGKQNNQRFNER